MKKEDKQIQWEKYEKVGIDIWMNCRNELYRYFPYLDGAFASLPYESVKEEQVGTDGVALYFSPTRLMKEYCKSPETVRRGYLHILLHCLYLHLYECENLRPKEQRLWNLACDISVEVILEKLFHEIPKDSSGIFNFKGAIHGKRLNETVYEKETKMDSEGRFCEEISDIKRNAGAAKEQIRKGCLALLKDTSVSALKIYKMLQNSEIPYKIEEMEEAFAFDDHIFWYQTCTKEKKEQLYKKWEKIRSYTNQNKEGSLSKAGNVSSADQERMDEVLVGTYDYRKFLKRFAFPREEVELDQESFDYIYYSLGMEQYGNMPLIEHLEYKEVNRLEELVIAIDTSGSCSRETVQRFLEETYRIFREKENFFHKMKVYIIQCDCHIQDVAIIHSEEEWKEYSKNILIQGRSGTNFRPVFDYVKKQQAQKELKNLKALIYFTDGDGVYPEKTEYETAFVFVKPCKGMQMVPSWAVKLLV